MTMILDGSNGLTMPTWTTANRPINPIIGAQGYNTTYGGVEVYNGSAWDLITGGPAFSAYPGSASNISNNTWTKLACTVKEFDTNNCYDATTNYRFTPTVPGYYQVSGTFSCSTTTLMIVAVYKNGSEFKRGVQTGGTTTLGQVVVSALVYLNGTTDYVELYGIQVSGSTQTLSNAANQLYFQAAYVRGQ